MRGIVVVGAAKTGTNGLYYAIRRGFESTGVPFYSLKERYPARYYRWLELYAPDRSILAKFVLTHPAFDSHVPPWFDRRILVVRDPRDTLVSALLFFPVLATNRGVPEERVAEFTELIRRKEEDPASFSVLSLLKEARAMTPGPVERGIAEARPGRLRLTIDYDNSVESFRVHYEDVVDDRLEKLGEYLGFDVRRSPAGPTAGHIARAGRYGDWRRWFTPADVDAYRRRLLPYMQRYSYADDWELDPHPVIAPAEASEYVERSVRARREQAAIVAARGSASEERVTFLRDRADDGDVRWSFRVARLLLQDDAGAHGAEVFERARFAACCGHPLAMRFLARCYAEGIGVAPDPQSGIFWQRESRAVLAERRQLRRLKRLDEQRTRLREQRDRLRRDLEAMRQSARYRLGNAVVEAATHPVRSVVVLPKRVVALTRHRSRSRAG